MRERPQHIFEFVLKPWGYYLLFCQQYTVKYSILVVSSELHYKHCSFYVSLLLVIWSKLNMYKRSLSCVFPFVTKTVCS